MANLLSLLDSVFLLFQNFPRRIAHSELKCDLVCDESLFNSTHPLSEPNFRYTRGIRVRDAFQSLFDKRHPRSVSHSLSPAGLSNYIHDPIDLTFFDMFVLIHRMCPFPLLLHITVEYCLISNAKCINGLQNYTILSTRI